jgi:4-diphosphocytidyl-2C-methyl-D-erythritol kinase
MVIVIPNFGVATKGAYAWLDSDRPKSVADQATGFGAPKAFPGWLDLARGTNEFEAVVEKRHPVLRRYRETLANSGAELVRMAGSGSCVFGIFPHTSPLPTDLGPDARVMHTRTAARVVQVEVLQ